ncbi:hypothetical protein JVU11DRAFT_7866 [Chiua virens]|nr:hypothetical protein JVU11DRAFT_7866 [Chiua virens]
MNRPYWSIWDRIVESDEEFAREMAGAFRILLEHHDQRGSDGMQVLWKVQAKGDIQEAINETIGKEIREGRVRVLAWLEAEPISILQHPNVVCVVHHGGANSFYEGVWSGVPQIVLPVWYDTFDYAHRVEMLNVGVFGNKTCTPGVKVEEFSKALLRVTGDSQEAVSFRLAAQRLKQVCRERGNRRQRASTAILKEIGM